VLLDVLVREYEAGEDAESIAHAYPTLRLADVHAAIAYYLRHKDEVGQIPAVARSRGPRKLREEVLKKQAGQPDLRAKLLARRAEQEQDHAAPCH